MAERKTLGDMVVRVLGDTDAFESNIDKAERKYVKFGKAAERIGKSMTAFVTAPLLAAAGAAVKFAIDAEETAAKFGTAFRDVRDEADETAKNLSRNYGLAESDAQALLASTGDLLKGFGATGEQALDLSDQVQRLAIDLASYNNIQGGGAEASRIITRALLGEREALIGLGVKVSEADVQAELLRQGFEDLEGQAALLAESQVTLQLIMQQSTDAMGDFERTSDSNANQLRILGARTKELAVQFGDVLLPTVNKILGRAIDLVERFQDMDDSQRKLILAVGGFVAAIGPLILVVGKTISVIQTLRVAMIALNASMASSPIGLILVTIGAVAGATFQLVKRLKEQKAAQEDVNTVLKENIELTKEQRVEQEIQSLQATLAAKRRAKEALEQGGITDRERDAYNKLVAQIEAYEQTLAQAMDASLRFSRESQAATEETADSGKKKWEDYRDAVFASIEAETRLAEQQNVIAEQLGKPFDLIAEKKQILEDAIDELLSIPADEIDKPFVATNNTIQELIDHIIELGATEEELERIRAANAEAEAARAEKKRERAKAAAEAEAARAEKKREQDAAEMQRLGLRTFAYFDSFQKIGKASEDYNAEEVDRVRSLSKTIVETMGNAFSAIADLSRALLDKRLSHIEAEKTAALAANDAQLQATLERLGIAEDSTIESLQKRRQKAIEEGDTQLAAELADEIERERIKKEYEKKRNDIIKKYTNEANQAAYEASMWQWGLSLIKGVADAALATLSVFANTPGDLITKGIAAGIAAAIGAVQVAAIAASKPETPPKLAKGGVVMPRSGGVPVTVAEAGVPEVVFPLDRLGEVLAAMPQPQMPDGLSSEGDIHLTVNLDSEPFLKKIFPATKNRLVLIDGGAVT